MLFLNRPGRSEAQELLESVGLGRQGEKIPNELSGGEGPGVLQSPGPLPTILRSLLADEPTGNLDSKTSDQIYDLFQES